jgi:hypothetical protein
MLVLGRKAPEVESCIFDQGFGERPSSFPVVCKLGIAYHLSSQALGVPIYGSPRVSKPSEGKAIDFESLME